MNQLQAASLLTILGLSIFTGCAPQAAEEAPQQTADERIFPRGNPGPSAVFTGNVFVHMLVTDQEQSFNTQVYNVEFEAGARSFWHSHPGGQILVGTEGVGYYQEEGQPIQEIHPGDVIEARPDVKHWHGASPDSDFTHLGMTTKVDAGPVNWQEEVTDEEYTNR